MGQLGRNELWKKIGGQMKTIDVALHLARLADTGTRFEVLSACRDSEHGNSNMPSAAEAADALDNVRAAAEEAAGLLALFDSDSDKHRASARDHWERMQDVLGAFVRVGEAARFGYADGKKEADDRDLLMTWAASEIHDVCEEWDDIRP